MTSVISTDNILINFGGIAMPGDAVDMNSKSVTIGGLTQPLLQYNVPGRALTIPYPSDNYEDEPITVYVNGYVLESHILPDPDTPEPWSVSITAPTVNAEVTADGTATAVVKDQFGDEMTSEAVAWTSGDTDKLTINSGTGAYVLVADGAVTITATSSTDSSKTATVAVTVDYTAP